MRFQPRDGRLLQALHDYDGVLSREQIQTLFWPQAQSMRAVHARLAKLRESGYLAWPTQEQRNTQPGPKSICWLGWRGAMWVAAQAGIQVEGPANDGENQMRKLERRLRQAGFHWLREPRWSQLVHDLAVVDFRLAVEGELAGHATLSLERWVNESVFRADTDTVEFTYQRRDGSVRRGKRGVIPDGYLVVLDQARRRQGDTEHRARLLLELDMATHPTGRFAKEKLLAGAAYIESAPYRARFGVSAGHWLVVTTGEVRMGHLMEKAQEVLGEGARRFFFTTFDRVQPGQVLTAPIWSWAGWEKPGPLLAGD
jgi:hypothetical protein